ncbi:hypothetical protein IMZ48_41215 [Candidatus Bathyarchaeota archaeon]|nr:hypothetical protein [Candidatus Bathyarchaeota archaeon]
MQKAHPASPGASAGTEQEVPGTRSPSKPSPGCETASAFAIPDQRPGNSSNATNAVSSTGLYVDTDRFLECKMTLKPRRYTAAGVSGVANLRTGLCSQASILGRAPGFNKDSVDAAIRQSLRRG